MTYKLGRETWTGNKPSCKYSTHNTLIEAQAAAHEEAGVLLNWDHDECCDKWVVLRPVNGVGYFINMETS